MNLNNYAQRLMDFVTDHGLTVWFLDDLTVRYADQAMDLADASLVVLAETLKLSKILTIKRGDFTTYRIKRGHRYLPFEILA